MNDFLNSQLTVCAESCEYDRMLSHRATNKLTVRRLLSSIIIKSSPHRKFNYFINQLLAHGHFPSHSFSTHGSNICAHFKVHSLPYVTCNWSIIYNSKIIIAIDLYPWYSRVSEKFIKYENKKINKAKIPNTYTVCSTHMIAYVSTNACRWAARSIVNFRQTGFFFWSVESSAH